MIWYACYGSNINKERFMRYINSCTDTTEPTEAMPFEIPYDIYFFGRCSIWSGKGVAYLDDTKEGHSYGKIYKVTKEQFREIKRMEGQNYTKRIVLGEIDGIPVYTFTCKNQFEKRTAPSLGYFQTILNGLKDLYCDCSESQMGAYLVDCVMSSAQYQVLRIIRNNTKSVSSIAIATLTNMELSSVIECVQKLVELKCIQQDRKSKKTGHTIENPDAYFFIRQDMSDCIDYMIQLKEEVERATICK